MASAPTQIAAPHDVDTALALTAAVPEFRAWLGQMERIGGCADPVYLIGHTLTFDAVTGDVLRVFSAADLPRGRLAVACGNRRASRCEPCSWLHQGDTYQLVVAGLAGGKGVPASVRRHPRVFLTLTAPSFGPVHRKSPETACRRRDGGKCPHGIPVACVARHAQDDPVVGTPLCPDCYDYPTAALWNAHAGALWADFTKRLRWAIASDVGIKRSELRERLRVSFAKVAEYQRRGSIHLHAVIRFDGPGGGDEPPPAWATVDALSEAIRRTAPAALINTVTADRTGEVLALRFGNQLDIKPISAADSGDSLTDVMVAGYVAKYVTKGDVGGLVHDKRLRWKGHADTLPLSGHAKALMHACWDLGGRDEYAALNLRTWAHQLGYRGHIASKSRAYSTTYGALREVRAEFRRHTNDVPDIGDAATVTQSMWLFDRQGHTAGEAMYAAGIAHEIAATRQARREALNG